MGDDPVPFNLVVSGTGAGEKRRRFAPDDDGVAGVDCAIGLHRPQVVGDALPDDATRQPVLHGRQPRRHSATPGPPADAVPVGQ